MKSQPEIIEKDMILIPRKEYENLLLDYKNLLAEFALMKGQLDQLKRMLFGAKSERFIPENTGQLSLEMGLETVETPTAQTEEIKYTRTKSKKEGKAIRLPLPAHLPRKTEIIEPENIPAGAKKIGVEITEILEFTPGRLYIKSIERPYYGLPKDEGVIIADLPSLPIPKGNAGASLLAHIQISKYVDHLPFYRQVQIFKREGVIIPESTINGWFNASCKLLEPLFEKMVARLLKSRYLQCDETPVPVLDSHKKGATHTGYHWVYHSPPDKIVCFDYQPGRSQIGPLKFLKDFEGDALQTDGYAAYDNLLPKNRVTQLACMAHARRKFEHALSNDKARAEHALNLFRQLYEIEREARELKLTYDQRKEFREKVAKPVINELESWMKSQALEVLPKSSIGQAISYTLNLWSRLKNYLNDGSYEIDNNLIENAIRPVALGRKNYLFAGSHDAAQRAAMMYSFFATCKLNNVNPQDWLTDVLSRISNHSVNRLDELLPMNWKPQAE